MPDTKVLNYITKVLKNMPTDWLLLTTHRLDIYNENLAKIEFLEQFENLYKNSNSETLALCKLPTAFDYIRLGHPLSCILEWTIGNLYHLKSTNVISFSSKVMPVLAILRKNLLDNKKTLVAYTDKLPDYFNTSILQEVYGYQLELKKVKNSSEVVSNSKSVIFISKQDDICNFNLSSNIDFYINFNTNLGSIIVVNGKQNEKYISEIQHVRRRETIAMTPANCLLALKAFVEQSSIQNISNNTTTNKLSVVRAIHTITNTNTKVLVGSSGLSVQYAILMGLIDNAIENYKGKDIKIVVPPNCYGGTNDQARRIATCLKNVEVVDFAVDGENDMVKNIDTILREIAKIDAVPYIIAEIPTNPRVEVPDIIQLRDVISKNRQTLTGKTAISPVFILDQTFCPNVRFLGDNDILSTVKTISFASGSKFASGGTCTAGYCVANRKAATLIDKIELHLNICDNEATQLQYEMLAKQIPSMNQRITKAYLNARNFVNYIEEVLPTAKINFVSEELAAKGFTPSVFSLDLPTKGTTNQERETYKRALNLQLINWMIDKIPTESKYCVSYGQLKGCYWTIPATSTQGTTKEGDKDYIARVALSANMDVELHKKVFLDFVNSIK